MPCKTPVVFLIYRRPDLTDRVFNVIKQAKPKQLFVIADGPKDDSEGIFCQQAREVTERIDWDCEVKRNYSDVNLGCRNRVSSGLDWVFRQVEETIVLEDDCLPHPTFFQYCEDLLERYRSDNRIMLISGTNSQGTWKTKHNDYFFSNLGGIWGWASWRRSWQLYDIDMADIYSFIEQKGFENLLGEKLGKFRMNQFLSLIQSKVDTWDFQWGYARHKNSGLSCVPSKNLIKNIGYRADATHTKEYRSELEIYSANIPLRQNNFLVPDREYDLKFFENIDSNKGYKNIFRNINKKAQEISCRLNFSKPG